MERSSNTKYKYVSESGTMVDYYFFYGPEFDQIISFISSNNRSGANVSKMGIRAFPVAGQVSKPGRSIIGKR